MFFSTRRIWIISAPPLLVPTGTVVRRAGFRWSVAANRSQQPWCRAACAPCGLRTRDFRLERPASWSTRRTGIGPPKLTRGRECRGGPTGGALFLSPRCAAGLPIHLRLRPAALDPALQLRHHVVDRGRGDLGLR